MKTVTAQQAAARLPSAGIWPLAYADERLDTLLSITGRMDGFLYRCRNDPSYTMLYISDGILSISGYAPEEFLNNRVREYSSAIHPADLALVYSAVDEALAARRNWNLDYRIVSRQGVSVWVREIGGGVFNDAGELVFLEGFVIDISDRKDIEELNTKLVEELRVANDGLTVQKRELELAKQHSDHTANHDLLTGLPNRRAFQDKLKDAIDLSTTTRTSAALLFIDLDKFKEVNDTLGHEAGDDLLRKVSARLRTILRNEDFVARVGGDEFAFLTFDDLAQAPARATQIARRIVGKLQFHLATPKGMIRVGCTVGIALCPGDATDPRELIALADHLMYVGKKSGRNRVVTRDDLCP